MCLPGICRTVKDSVCGRGLRGMVQNAKKPNMVVDFAAELCYNHFRWFVNDGEMAERLKALVLKTSDTERYRGFESLSLRQHTR